MRSRWIIGATIAALLGSGLVAVAPAGDAQALTAGMPVSADALPTWQTNAQVFGLASSNGRIVAGGAFTQLRPGAGQSGTVQNLRGVAILDAATGQPDACQLPASIASGTATVYAVATSPDGSTVFVGGNFSSIGGVSRSRLAEIDVRNCRVTSFNPVSISSTVQSIAVTSDAVYIGGLFQTVGGQQRRSFAKLTRTGALVNWSANAYGATVDSYSTTVDPNANARGTAIAVSPTGDRVVIGGNFFYVNGQQTHSFSVVSAADGSVVRTWPASTVGNTSRTKALVSDGERFYVGQEGFNGFDGSLAYNWSDYSQAWRDNCAGATQALALKDGVLFEAHHHHDCTGQGMFPDGRRTYLSASVAADPAQLHLGWLPELNDGTGEGLGPRALSFGVGSNGTDYLWVGGEFTRVNGTNQQGLTRFGPTDTGNPPVPTVAARAITPGAVQVNIRGVVDPDDSAITYAVYRGSNTTTPVWTGVANSQHWYRNQVTFVDTAVTPGTAYSYRVRAIDAAGNQSGLSASVSATPTAAGSAYASTVLADGPRLYWRYDDTATAQWVIDSAGQTTQGLNGLAQNGVARTATGALAGDTSRSATFSESQASGLPQYIWNDVIARGPSTYSIETWVRTTSTTGGALVNYGSSNGRPRSDDGTDRVSSTVDRVLYMESGSGFVRFGVRAGSGTTTIRSTSQVNNGQWHHIVATQSSAGMRLYIDGVLQGQNSTTGNGTYNGTWHAGGDNLSGYPSTGNSQTARYFDGQLDETAVYYSALPANRVAAHYTVANGGGGDTTPPSTPGSFGAVVAGDDVTLTWAASVDNVGVTGYEVHRGTTSGFVPDVASRVTTVTTTSYVDADRPVGTWYYRVIALDAAGNRSATTGPAVATITPPDTTAPTVPGTPSAAVNGSTVTLGWAASADDIGVTGYGVHRGTTPDFTADASSRIATVTTPGFVDAGVPAGTWYYRVTAYDAAGNTSAATASAPATVASTPTTTVQTIVADADTMAAAVNPAFVYGTSTQISSRFDTAIESFLRFTLPAAPPGATLTGATLSVRTSTDPTAGSADVHELRIVDTAWDEATLVWNNRPTTGIGTSVLGQLSGASAVNTPYSATLQASLLDGRGGSAVTLRLASTAGTDNVRLWSREAGTASYRPTLTLTYTTP